MMKNFDTRVYNISDFIEWRDTGLLDLSPEFQRRSVWTEKAKSYLIDTIIRGKPVPKMLITQKLDRKRNIRVVVDGQQRLRAILDFYDGNFKISRAHNRELGGLYYDQIPKDDANDFLKYEIGVDLLYDVPYHEILDIFARINTYTVKLNIQESRNAKYLGYFKQTAYSLGYEFVEYFIEGKVVSKSQVNRMAEAELSSDLLVAMIDGVQTNKNIDQFYRKFEDTPGPLDKISELFRNVMWHIAQIYPAKDLAETNWSRIQLFYSLFVSVSHCFEENPALDAPKVQISEKNIGKIRLILDEISARFDEYTSSKFFGDIPVDYEEFIDKARRATTDTASRKLRSEFICQKIHSNI